ncbi:phage tail tape measure protein [Streptococcus parauberis]|uniref:Phage tail tape measure protein, TP901 family n=1 Tax=Streptococcus parauberis NCFD 2020 TaxID=873447 RepID=F1Z0N2_9STRE|nr:phage tail tape measure protein [Streptococcus parauberis]EGE54752.1 phage tail tape measure protein, TP901 family [Streptococcus parauberis NCFD 2020]QBX18339.1 tail length tape-measure protein [Streptococcus phage Javan411]QBX27606.1 tail length tape-measure protein [Streptococcus phage Javan400]
MSETYEGLYVKFGADTVEFDKSVKGINGALSTLKKDFTNINRQLKFDPDNTELLNRKLENLQEQARLGALKIEELKNKQAQLGKDEIGSDKWMKLQVEIEKVSTQMNSVDVAMNKTKQHIEDVGNPQSILNLNKAIGDIGQELDIVNRKLQLDPGNVELTEQKMKLLGEQAEYAEQKVDGLKDKQSALGNDNIGTEEWKRLQNEIGQAEIEVMEIDRAMKGLDDSSAQAGAGIKEATSYLKADVMMEVADAAQEVGQKLVEAGKMAVEAWKEVDDSMDTVATKTGATGKELESLQSVVSGVIGSISTDFQTAGDAIGSLNTQFGFTGEKLQSASEQLIKYSQINGTDVTDSAMSAKQAIEAFGLSNDDLGKVLDNVTKVAQETDQSVDDIIQKAIDGAPQIKMLGLSFEEGANLIGKFEKSGIDSASALTSLSKASVNYAKDGKSLEEGLKGTVDQIKNSKDETEALTIASEIFGSKAAPRMVDAIQRGALTFDDLAKASEGASGTVSKTFEATQDPFDKLTVASNQAKEAMAEFGGTLIETVAPVLETLGDILKSFAGWFKDLPAPVKEFSVVLGLVITAVGVLAPIFIALQAAALAAGTTIGALIAGAMPIIGIVAGIALAIAGLVIGLKYLWETNEGFREAVTIAWEFISTTIQTVVQIIYDFVMTMWGEITTWWIENQELIRSTAEIVWNFILTTIQFVMETLWPYLQAQWENIQTIIFSAWEIIKTTISTALDIILGVIKAVMQVINGDWSGAWETIKGVLQSTWDGILNIVSTVINAILSVMSNTLNGIWGVVQNIWDAIFNTISEKINGAKEAVATAIEAIKELFNFQFQWPHIPLPYFSASGSVNPIDWITDPSTRPSIDVQWFAKGGIMTKPTLFGMNGNRAMVGGEAGNEAILPLNSKTLGMIGQGIANTMNTNNAIEVKISDVVVRNDNDITSIAEEVSNRLAYEIRRQSSLGGRA